MKRAIFIGQAMPRYKSNPHDWRELNNWLFSIDLTFKEIQTNFLYTALIDYFPGAKNGSHLVPTGKQIKEDRPRLLKTIRDFDPQVFVTIGKLSLSYCMGLKIDKLDKYIGKVFSIDPYGAFKSELPVIPFPHPSGASTWVHKPDNKRLLEKALGLLKSNLT